MADRTTDTFVDALGRCYIAGQRVPQPVFERYQAQWFELGELVAELWRQVVALTAGDEVPSLGPAQSALVDEALHAFPPAVEEDLDDDYAEVERVADVGGLPTVAEVRR